MTIMNLELFIAIIEIVCVGCTVSKSVNIDFVTKPVTFGETAEISCIAKGTEIPLNESSRSWTGGPNNTLLCKDGISANKQKYKEKMGKDKSQFILQIYNFSELDADCIYSCTFGVDSAMKTFNLTEEDYQYPMTKEMIQVTPYFEKDNLKVDINFIKVWPTPSCEISFEGINYDANKTSKTKKSKGKLYSAIITLRFRKHTCRGEMSVVCHIGNQHIVVEKKTLDMCSVTGGYNTVNKFYARLIIGIVISVILTLVVAVPYVLLQKQERRHCVFLNLGCNCSVRSQVRRQRSRDSEHPDDTAFINSNTEDLSPSIYQT